MQGGSRNPANWFSRIAPTPEALEGKGSLHLLHGIDLARAMQQVMRYLELSGSATGQDNVPPFELRALEALLLLNSRGIKNVVTELQERVYRTIPQLRFGVSPAELRDLLECKRTVEDCLMSGRAIQSALSTVLGEGASSFSLSRGAGCWPRAS